MPLLSTPRVHQVLEFMSTESGKFITRKAKSCIVAALFAPCLNPLFSFRFYFPIKGPNMLNPAMWATLLIPLSGVMVFANMSIVRYFKKNGVILHNTNMPKEEDPSFALEDGSIPFVPAFADSYGSIS